MCKCTPEVRTPFCGEGDCKWPPQVKTTEQPKYKLLDKVWFITSHGAKNGVITTIKLEALENGQIIEHYNIGYYQYTNYEPDSLFPTKEALIASL